MLLLLFLPAIVHTILDLVRKPLYLFSKSRSRSLSLLQISPFPLSSSPPLSRSSSQTCFALIPCPFSLAETNDERDQQRTRISRPDWPEFRWLAWLSPSLRPTTNENRNERWYLRSLVRPDWPDSFVGWYDFLPFWDQRHTRPVPNDTMTNDDTFGHSFVQTGQVVSLEGISFSRAETNDERDQKRTKKNSGNSFVRTDWRDSFVGWYLPFLCFPIFFGDIENLAIFSPKNSKISCIYNAGITHYRKFSQFFHQK